jgi:hypothetical protein
LKPIALERTTGDPPGSEKHNATASASSGDGMPRFFMSDFASSKSRPLKAKKLGLTIKRKGKMKK